MATNIDNLRGKEENEGINEHGRLSASEFDTLVRAVQENQGSVKSIKYGSLDPIYPDSNGMATIPIISDTWEDVLRLQRKVTRNYEEVYETVSGEGTYLYADANVQMRFRFQEYRQRVDEESGDTTYEASNAQVTIRLYKEAVTGNEELASFQYNARGYGSTDWMDLNLQNYLSGGENVLLMEITNSSRGEATRLRFTVVVANLSISVSDDTGWSRRAIIVGEQTELNAEYFVGGAIDRNLCVKFTGSSGTTSIRTTFVPRATSASTSFVSAFMLSEDNIGFFAEGLKTVTAWVEATVGDETVRTDELVTNIIAVNSGSTSTFVAIQGMVDTVVNYDSVKLFDYTVYSADNAADVQIILANSNGETVYYTSPVINGVANNTVYPFSVQLQIATQSENVRVYVYAKVDGEFVNNGNSLGDFLVDNSEDFSAVSGASFYMNPVLRSNTETRPDRILNDADGGNEIAGAVFSNVSFIEGVDGWMTGGYLRLLAGSTLTIPYNIYSDFTTDSRNSLTVEVDFAVRNVTNESDPVFTIGNRDNANPKGIHMRALEGAFMSQSNNSWSAAKVAWQEGVRTHIVFNFQYNYLLTSPEPGRGRTDSAYVNIIRTYINGVINKEFRVDNVSSSNEINAGGDIVIGQSGCDIDIYGIRVYKRNLTPEQVVKNYISTLPTVTEKKKFYDTNDILDNGVVSFEKCLAKGYNCIVWHGTHLSKRYENNPKRYGYAEIYKYNDGQLDLSHSGTLYGIEASGQGTTAMTYADWNFSFKEDKKFKGKNNGGVYWQDPDDDYADKCCFVGRDGVAGFGKKKFGYRLDEGDPVAKKLVGKINYASSMQSHKEGACNMYNDLYARIVDDSITDFSDGQRVTVKEKPFLYFVQETEGGSNELKVFKGLCTFGPGKADKPTWGVDDDTLTAGDSLIEGALNNNPLTDMRVPFVDTINPVTGRYVCEYQLHSDIDGAADPEAFVYAGGKNLNWGFGDTWELHKSSGTVDGVVWDGVREADKTEDDAPTRMQVKMWQPIWNFLYLMNTRISPWTGTLNELNVAARDVSFDTSVAYWMNSTVPNQYNKFDLYRCHYNADGTREYVPAGIRLVQGSRTFTNFATLYDLSASPTGVTGYTDDDLWYDVSDASTDTRDIVLNLQTEMQSLITRFGYTAINFNDDAEVVNLAIRKLICKVFREYVDKNVYLNKKSVLFHHEMMVLWAGTDNRSKNTYYRLNPYATQTVNGVSHSWPNMEMNQDDLDTIFKTNNSGIQSKEYFVLERDWDDSSDEPYWQGQDNVLNNTLCDAYGYNVDFETEDVNMTLPNMMGSIFNGLVALAGGKTMPDGTAVANSPEGCFDYYFFAIQKYFPAVAYNETARVRYEIPAVLYRSVAENDGGESYPQDPIGQSLGDQYDSEKDYIRRRITMLAGYAGYRMNQFGFRGYAGNFQLALQPHQYLYPMYEVGDQRSSTPTRSMRRISPSDTYNMVINNNSSTNGVYIYFIGSMREIGNMASWGNGTASAEAEDNAMSIPGARLVLLEMWSDEAEGVIFNPRAGSFDLSACQNVEEIDMHNAYRLTGLVGIDKLIRLRSLDLRGTAVTSAALPQSPNITTVKLPAVTSIEASRCPNLATLTLDSYASLTSLILGIVSPSLDTIGMVNACRTERAQLTTLSLQDVAWTGCTQQLLQYICDVPNVSLTGTIDMYNQNNAKLLSFELKKKLIERFGNIDDPSNPLRVTYTSSALSSVDISGDGYFTPAEAGTADSITKHYDILPNNSNANGFTAVEWSVAASDGSGENIDNIASVDSLGNVTVLSSALVADIMNDATYGSTYNQYGTGPTFTLTCTVTLSDGSTLSNTITIRRYEREARVGDYVYADGTYDNVYKPARGLIGICYYSQIVYQSNGDVNYVDRRMVALSNIPNTYQTGLYNSSTNGVSGVTVNGTSAYDVPLLTNTTAATNTGQNGLTNAGVFYDTTPQNSLFPEYDSQRYLIVSNSTTLARGRMTRITVTEDVSPYLSDTIVSSAGTNIVPYGRNDTACIIRWRNLVLAATVFDNGTPDDTEDDIPYSRFQPDDSSIAELRSKMAAIVDFARDEENGLGVSNYANYSQFLYPAASACYAYEPSVPDGVTLDPRFGARHWYLPSCGELGLLWLYSSNTASSIFKDAVFSKKGITRLTTPSSSIRYISSTEGIVNYFLALDSNNSGVGLHRYANYETFYIRPVCQF